MILSICEDPKVLEIARLINIFITAIRIVVPIVLIFALMFKLISAIMSDNADGLKKVLKIAPKNLAAAAIVFLIPSIVRLAVRFTSGDTSYENCLKVVSTSQIEAAYESKMEELLSYAETMVTLDNYNKAYKYLRNIKDEDKRKEYEERLIELKAKIDASQNIIAGGKNNYADVNYSNWSWTYYRAKSGPNSKYYSGTTPYAVWAPKNVDDLNGVSLPLIIWLHGSGEVTSGIDSSQFTYRGLPDVVRNWSQNKLDSIPAIIVAPQSSGGWNSNENYETIEALIKYAKNTYNIDSSKIVLMGHSMGGAGTYYVASKFKTYFSAVVMMSSFISNVDADNISYFKNIPLKGYVENASPEKFKNPMISFFKQLGKSDDLTFLDCSHGSVPKVVLTTDANSDGVSDLVYWLFGKNESATTASIAPGDDVTPGNFIADSGETPKCNKNGKYQSCSPSKGVFGSFPYYDSAPGSTENRWTLEMDPKWARENFVSISKTCSNGWKLDFKVHKNAKSTWEQVLEKLCQITTTGIDGYKYSPNDFVFSGKSPVVRFVSNSKSISNHSYGTALDINPSVSYTVNGKKYTPYNRDVKEYEAFVSALGREDDPRNINYILWKKIFQPLGFTWGGNWGRHGSKSTYDGMHYEIISK